MEIIEMLALLKLQIAKIEYEQVATPKRDRNSWTLMPRDTLIELSNTLRDIQKQLEEVRYGN